MCEWFIDNRLTIDFGKDKTKCILFNKEKNLPEHNITCDGNRAKHLHIVKCLGCYLDATLSGESMAMKSQCKVTVLI